MNTFKCEYKLKNTPWKGAVNVSYEDGNCPLTVKKALEQHYGDNLECVISIEYHSTAKDFRESGDFFGWD